MFNDGIVSGAVKMEFKAINHGNLKYNETEIRFYYESLGKNPLEYEKESYKILDGAILPFPETIELKLTYF